MLRTFDQENLYIHSDKAHGTCPNTSIKTKTKELSIAVNSQHNENKQYKDAPNPIYAAFEESLTEIGEVYQRLADS
ncbi:MAG: hypothetical protein BRC33_05120 [Cyanobacteria bacterium SW_9_44_58]|nr:MAG: hypothetical protein BRC33_05120 [Cyanobacteria bacterium SW_9_44_58]